MERRLIAVKRQRSLEPSLDLFSYPNPDSRSYLMFHKLDRVCVCVGGHFEAPGYTVLVEIEA